LQASASFKDAQFVGCGEASSGRLLDHLGIRNGVFATVMNCYCEWLQCGDRAFLESLWPGVVKAVKFAWQPGSWDADKDGVMEDEVEFGGLRRAMFALTANLRKIVPNDRNGSLATSCDGNTYQASPFT
jgi:hypothetical protein